MFITTTFTIEGYHITEYKGLVRGIIVRAPTIAQGIIGGFKNIIGGRIGAYTEMCEQARQQAYDAMLKHGEELGANAIVGVDMTRLRWSAKAPLPRCCVTAQQLLFRNYELCTRPDAGVNRCCRCPFRYRHSRTVAVCQEPAAVEHAAAGHLTMLTDFQMPVAVDAHDRKLLSNVASYGWHVPYILADESGPGYSFSVGLYLKFEHPEILVMGLSQPIGHKFINLAAGYIASGRVFRPRERTEDLAQGFACSFVPILVDHYQRYLGCDIWFYRSLKQPFPALQLVWPDKQGRFPWESNYDQRFFTLQRLLDVV